MLLVLCAARGAAWGELQDEGSAGHREGPGEGQDRPPGTGPEPGEGRSSSTRPSTHR